MYRTHLTLTLLALSALTSPAQASASLAPGTSRAPAAVAQRFYDAFRVRDVATMGALYAPEARFRDPVFGRLTGGQIGKMWLKTIGQNDTAKIAYTLERADEARAIVRWQASYRLFGRPVENHAVSYLRIEDGQIVKQRDFYSWPRWSRQALPIGPLSESPLVHRLLTGLFRLTLR